MPDPTTTTGTNGVFDRSAVMKAVHRTAVVSGAFCLVLWLALLGQHFHFKADDPLKSIRINELKEQLRAAPKDESLKSEIRELDLELRRRYFLHLRLTDNGSWLLLGGGILFLALAAKARGLRRTPYLPQGRRAEAEEMARMTGLARTSVAAIALITLSALTTLAFSVSTKLPRSTGELEKLFSDKVGTPTAAAGSAIPSRDEFNRNWPQFRGPTGSGVSFDTNPPVAFAPASILWKTELSSAGFNSPVVWGERVFISAGDAGQREVFCFNAGTGALLWRKAVQSTSGRGSDVSVPEATGYASSTMATDGQRVYAIFATYDLVAFDFDGNQLWLKNFGKPQNQHGHASSLAAWQDRVVVQLDQGAEDEGLSKLYAFDGKTGEVAWQRPRPVGESWASPIIIESAGKQQIITAAAPWVIAYVPEDGNELWRFNGLHGEVTSSPAFGGGNVFAVTAYETIFAIRADGHGDLTKTHQTWTSEDNAPDISSPAATDDLVFILGTTGLLTCHEIKTGEKVWENDFKTEFFASPAIANGHLYLFATDGTAIVVEANRSFREISQAQLNEKISASPAFAWNQIYVRGHKHLFCFGSRTKQLAKANQQ